MGGFAKSAFKTFSPIGRVADKGIIGLSPVAMAIKDPSTLSPIMELDKKETARKQKNVKSNPQQQGTSLLGKA